MTDYATAVTRLKSRIRQVGDIALDNDDAINILGMSQQYVNIALKRYTAETSFTTLKEKLIYVFNTDLTEALDILAIYDNDRELLKVSTLEEFSTYDANWIRNITGSRFEAWFQVSRDAFIIYPAKDADSSVDIEYLVHTPIYTDYSTYSAEDLLLPDEDLELILKIAELVCYLRTRQIGIIKKTLEQILWLFEVQNVSFKSTNLKSLLEIGS